MCTAQGGAARKSKQRSNEGSKRNKKKTKQEDGKRKKKKKQKKEEAAQTQHNHHQHQPPSTKNRPSTARKRKEPTSEKKQAQEQTGASGKKGGGQKEKEKGGRKRERERGKRGHGRTRTKREREGGATNEQQAAAGSGFWTTPQTPSTRRPWENTTCRDSGCNRGSGERLVREKKWPAEPSNARWSEPVLSRRAGRMANSGRLRIKTTRKFCGQAGIAVWEWKASRQVPTRAPSVNWMRNQWPSGRKTPGGKLKRGLRPQN